MNPAAFARLKQEVSLEPVELALPALWGKEKFRLHTALVAVDNDIFRRIVVRESWIPIIDPRTFSLQKWTEKPYYEVCTDSAIYAALERRKGAISGS